MKYFTWCTYSKMEKNEGNTSFKPLSSTIFRFPTFPNPCFLFRTKNKHENTSRQTARWRSCTNSCCWDLAGAMAVSQHEGVDFWSNSYDIGSWVYYWSCWQYMATLHDTCLCYVSFCFCLNLGEYWINYQPTTVKSNFDYNFQPNQL